MSALNPRKPGFTIVELIVVIVVIAILAAIAIVSYQFVTDDARDSARRQGASQLAKSIQVLMTKKAPRFFGGGGAAVIGADGLCPDGGGGWVYHSEYLCDMGKMLIANNLMTADFFNTFPPNEEFMPTESALGKSHHATMLYSCPARQSIVLHYYLKNPTTEEVSSYNTIAQSCGQLWVAGYKMKAAIEIKI